MIRLHLSDKGTVWLGDDHTMAADTRMSPEEICTSQALPQGSTVRLLGCTDNAPLVEQLYISRSKRRLPLHIKVQLGSNSSLCQKAVTPEAVLAALWYACVSKDMFSQWHELVDSDFPVYSLLASYKAAGSRPCGKSIQILKYHPAWPALSFLPDHHVDSCITMLAEIGDVRWFANPHRPHRATRLFSYLGVTPENMKAIANGRTHGGRHFQRAVVSTTAWLGFPHSFSRETVSSDLPTGFLDRIVLSADTTDRGVLLATRKFLHFVKEVWLSERSPHQQLFDPSCCFKRPDEIKAYAEHRARIARAPAAVD